MEGKCLHDRSQVVSQLHSDFGEAQSDQLSGLIVPFLLSSDPWVNLAKGPSDHIEIVIIDFIDGKSIGRTCIVLLFKSCYVKVLKGPLSLRLGFNVLWPFV